MRHPPGWGFGGRVDHSGMTRSTIVSLRSPTGPISIGRNTLLGGVSTDPRDRIGAGTVFETERRRHPLSAGVLLARRRVVLRCVRRGGRRSPRGDRRRTRRQQRRAVGTTRLRQSLSDWRFYWSQIDSRQGLSVGLVSSTTLSKVGDIAGVSPE